jgi:hypothetical protein
VITKIVLLLAVIATAVIVVYAVELSVRVFSGTGRFEILAAVIIILVLLFLADMILLARRKKPTMENVSRDLCRALRLLPDYAAFTKTFF